MARTIELTNGYTAKVDDADYDRINAHRWRGAVSPSGVVYAVRSARIGKHWVTVMMHREVMGYGPDDPIVDHANGDGLDNTRGNLRDATPLENAQNCQRRADNTSGYKGVSWHKATRKWRAQIRGGGRKLHLGLFTDAAEAARAWDAEAKRRFGRFARLNNPDATTAPAD